MMKFRIVISVLLVALALPMAARLTYTQKLKQKGYVVLNQDKTLDLLVNGREDDPTMSTQESSKPVKSAGGSTTTQPSTNKPIANETPASKKPENTLNPGVAKQEDAVTPEKQATTIRSNASSYTSAVGYRVKFFMGGSSRADKEKAQTMGKEFKAQFPNTPVYMNFNSPHWICVAGDFRTQQDASAFIRSIKDSGYDTSNMTIVKTKIRVPVQ